jgi:hypothetical protein
MNKQRAVIIIIVIILNSVFSLPGYGQFKFRTVAESSEFKSTSNYEEVMDFSSQLKKASPEVRIENIARTTEGWEVPFSSIQ